MLFFVSILSEYFTAISAQSWPFWRLDFIKSCMQARHSASGSLAKNSIIISLGIAWEFIMILLASGRSLVF